MFNYTSDISSLYHHIIKCYALKGGAAVDATLGNGHDTDLLSTHFSKVYSFDIQKKAIDEYASKNKNNVVLIYDSHEKLGLYIKEPLDVIIFNLGFLPGSDKTLTTKLESTLSSVESGLQLLKSGGMMFIASYPGHDEGKRETSGLMGFLSNLSKGAYGVVMHTLINRSNAPVLFVIEKK